MGMQIAGLSNEIIIDKRFSPFNGGGHILQVEVFKPDGSIQLARQAKAFNIGGILRFDVVATCLDQEVARGRETSARVNLINLGDFFQDQQFSWWVEGGNGVTFGRGEFPLALYPDESRSIIRTVQIPIEAEPGEYTFHAQLNSVDQNLTGECVFNVIKRATFYSNQLSYARERLSELSESIILKGLTADQFTQFKLDELKENVLLLEEAVGDEDFEEAERIWLRIDDDLDSLSQHIEKSSGGLQSLNPMMAGIAVTVVGLVAVGLWALNSGRAAGSVASAITGATANTSNPISANQKAMQEQHEKVLRELRQEMGFNQRVPASSASPEASTLESMAEEYDNVLKSWESEDSTKKIKKGFVSGLLGLK